MSHSHTMFSASDSAPNSSRDGLKLFFSFFWRNPRLMIIAILLLLVNSYLLLQPAIIISQSLEILFLDGYGEQFLLKAAFLLFIALITYFTTMLSSYFFSITAFALERDVRQEFFDTVTETSMTFHDQNNSSNLLSLGLNEAHFMSAGAMMLRIILQSIFSIVIVLYYFQDIFDSKFIYGVTIGFILYFVFSIQYASKVVPIRKERSQSLASLTEISQEIFRGIQVVKSFSSEEREVERFIRINEENASLSEREGQLRAFYIPGLVLVLITVFVFGYSVFLISNGELAVSKLVEILGLLLTLQFVNLQIPTIILTVRAGIINADRISAKIHDAKQLKRKNGMKDKAFLMQKINEIEFDDVTFAYPETSKAVVKRLSFKIYAGEKIVLLGGPGSGKSSLLKLILGLYTPQHGHIRLNGTDLRSLTEAEISNHVAMVEQDVFLFAGTIRENVGFVNPNASDEELLNALEMSQAKEFVDKLEDGLDTVIGERGVTLSGGQKQRLAIARALLADPEILLLDDSTSAVDSKTENLISKAIENLSSNRTTISVAQRLNVLVNADKIIFLEKGVMVGFGSHEVLYATNEKYKMIFDLLPDSSQQHDDQKKMKINTLQEGGN